ncbi:MAG TPA: hypothetical protein DCL15_09435 [Chloroflexi bacterium]|nr:hypothetical protein [Chloroflexota bacterium]HHW88098.1 hypothetical protein [Chloroflexota bacterium]
MVRGRFLLAGVLALVVLALIFGAVTNGQRDAWTQGYLVGRLTAVEGEGALAATGLLPYAAYGFPQRGPGFGGLVFLLLGIGALAFIGSRFAHMAQWRAWAARQGMTPESYPNAPWGDPSLGRGWMGWGCGGYQHHPSQETPVTGEKAEEKAER